MVDVEVDTDVEGVDDPEARPRVAAADVLRRVAFELYDDVGRRRHRAVEQPLHDVQVCDVARDETVAPPLRVRVDAVQRFASK